MQTVKSRDRFFMAQAIREAIRGEGTVHPNPLVGAVLATPTRVISKGAHLFFGGPHAEINALRGSSNISQKATLYVTLEPCCHFGKTPPCVDALIRHKIRRVVVAMQDPNPRVRGRGIQMLRSAGIQVHVGVLEKEAQELNQAYLHWMKTKKPFVTIKCGQSVDGNIATRSGKSRWITGPASRKKGQLLRRASDAILVGVRTVLADNPRLTVRPAGVRKQPFRVILDSDLQTPKGSKIFSRGPSGRVIIFTSKKASRSRRKVLESKAEIVTVSESKPGRLAWTPVLKELGKRGVTQLLIEGGGEVISDALFHHVAQEIYFFTAPIVIGGNQATRSVGGLGAGSLKDAIRLKRWKVERLGQDILMYGKL